MIAAVLSGAASILCVANVTDFPAAVLANFGVEVQAPDEFLGALVDRYPACSAFSRRQSRTSSARPASRLLRCCDVRAPLSQQAVFNGYSASRELSCVMASRRPPPRSELDAR